MNYHDGNEYFRKLVRKHKLEYVNCPKQQKGKFSKLIVDEIKARNPPGRFLKQSKDSKLWYDIGEKKALDKTRQALREGAPELMNNGKPSKEETAGDTALIKPAIEQGHVSNSEFSILQQSLMSLGNDSFNQSGQMTMNHNPYNMQGIGLSPNLFGDSSNNNNINSSGNSRNDTNRMGNLSQVVPPPQVHSNESNLLQKNQEQQLQQLRYLEQQQRQQQQQRQSRSNHFSSKQEQEIIRNATAVMGNDFNQQQQQQQQPTKMHMDQLRINRLKEKRKLLEQQILHQRQLELMELQKLRNQQKANAFQQNDSNQGQQQHPTSSEMRGALQNRLGAIYAGTDFLEPTPMPGNQQKQMLPPSSLSNGGSSSLDVTAELSGGTEPLKDRRSGLVRENSLKMESVFDNSSGGNVTTSNNPKKNFNVSASGMSMSATSLSLGFDEEGELSALFDTSMKIEGAVARGYATTLNDRGSRTPLSLIHI